MTIVATNVAYVLMAFCLRAAFDFIPASRVFHRLTLYMMNII